MEPAGAKPRPRQHRCDTLDVRKMEEAYVHYPPTLFATAGPNVRPLLDTTFTREQRLRIETATDEFQSREPRAASDKLAARRERSRFINAFRDDQSTHCWTCRAVLPRSLDRRPRLCPTCATASVAARRRASKQRSKHARDHSVYAYQGGAPGLGKRA